MNENELSGIIVDAAIMERKAVTTYDPIFESQLLTYLLLTDLKLVIVNNFGQRLVKHGIHRVANGLDDNK